MRNYYKFHPAIAPKIFLVVLALGFLLPPRAGPQEARVGDVAAAQNQIEQRIDSLLAVGGELFMAGDLEGAASKWEQARSLCKQSGLSKCEFIASGRLLALEIISGGSEETLHAEETLLKEVREQGFREEELSILFALGSARLLKGSVAEARGYLTDALVIAKEIGNYRKEVELASILATLEESLGRPATALQIQLDQLSAAQRLDDREMEATILGKLARLYLSHGQIEKAQESIQVALKIDQQLGNKLLEAEHLSVVARLSLGKGEVNQAIEQAFRASELFRKSGNNLQLTEALCLLAWAYAADGQSELAFSVLEEVEKLTQSQRLPLVDMMVAEARAEVHEALGDKVAARDAYLVLLKRIPESGQMISFRANAYSRIAQFSLALNDYEKAVEYGGFSLSAHRELGNSVGILNAVRILLSVLERSDKGHVVLQTLLQAVDSSSKRRQPYNTAVLLFGTSDAYITVGQPSKAIGMAREAKSLFQSLGMDAEFVNAVVNEALALHNTGSVGAALAVLKEANDVVQRLEVLAPKARYFSVLTTSLAQSGQVQLALEHGSIALTLAEQVGDDSQKASVLLALSLAYRELSKRSEAMEAATEALDLSRSLGSSFREVEAELALGDVLSRFDGPQSAIGHYERAYRIASEIGNLPLSSRSLVSLGVNLGLIGEIDKALERIRKAKEIYLGVNDQRGIADSEFAQGSILIGRDPRKAIEHFLLAAEISGEIDFFRFEMFSYQMAGSSAATLGAIDEAKGYLTKAEQIAEENGTDADKLKVLLSFADLFQMTKDFANGLSVAVRASELAQKLDLPENEAQALRSAAYFYEASGENERAVAVRLKALNIEREFRLAPQMAMSLAAIANLFSKIGENRKATDAAQEAIKVASRTGSMSLEGIVFMQLADIYRRLHEDEQALLLDRKALEIAQSTGDQSSIAGAHGSISTDYYLLGEDQKAFDHALHSLEAAKLTGNPRLVSTSLTRAADRARDLELYDQSSRFIQEASEILDQSPDSELRDLLRGSQALMLLKQGNLEDAEKVLQQRLASGRGSGVKERVLRTLKAIGIVWAMRGQFEKAVPYLEEAQGIAESLASPDELSDVFGFLGWVHASAGNIEKGFGLLVQADEFRDQVWAQAPKEDRPSEFLKGRVSLYVELVRAAYKLYKRSNNDSRYAREAFNFSEKAKARNLTETFSRASLEEVSRLIPKEIRIKERRIRESVERAKARYTDAISELELSPELESELRRNYQELVAQQSAFVDFLREEHPLYASAKYSSVTPLSKLPLQPDEILVEFFVTDEEVFRWVAYRAGQEVQIEQFDRIPVSYQMLKEMIVDTLLPVEILRMTRTWGGESYGASPASMELSEILLGSVLHTLKGARRLVIVPDHILNVLPFEMLPSNESPSQLLVEAWEISYAPSASFLSQMRHHSRSARPTAQLAFLIGDPVYELTDNAMSVEVDRTRTIRQEAEERGYSLGRLPATREEVLKIAQVLKRNGYEAEVLLGADARESSVKNIDRSQTRYWHIAAHALLGEKLPYLREPAVVLSLHDPDGEDGFLTLTEILNLSTRADLIVLSACSTGIGKYREGEGPLTLSTAFLYAGARSVVASLWEVSDESTSVLMQHFYKFFLQGMTKAEALRLAKIELRKRGYDHPFFWAPFIIWGE